MADTIKQKILFQMGTTGTGKATKSFASMATKIVAVGAALTVAVKGMNKLYDSAVELDRQLKALNTDMSIYNQETKGLIGTNDGLSAAIQLQNAGIKASAEEMSALGKAAIQMNQQLGGGPDGATTIFNGLVKSIVNARETGLVKFGVELSQTADKTAASQEALAKLTDKFGDVNVEAETAKEKMFAFNNSLGTVAASEFNGILTNMNSLLASSVTWLSGSADAMTDYENDILATNGAISEFMWSMEGMVLRHKIWINSLNDNTEFVAKLNAEYREQVNLLTNIANLERSIAGKKQKLADFAQIDQLRNKFLNAEDKRSQEIFGTRLQNIVRGKAREDMSSKERAIFDSGILDMKFGGTKKKDTPITPPSGRGSRRNPVDDMTFEDGNLGVVGDVFAGSTVDRSGLFSGGLDSIGDFGTASGAGGAANQAQEQARLTAEAQLAAKQNMFHSLLGMEGQYYAESNRMHALSNQEKAQATTDMVSTTGAILSNASKAIDAESRKGFKAKQVADYSLNAITTAGSAISGFKSVMDSAIPFPANVIAGGALATSITAAGMSAGRKIRQQKYGGGGSGTVSAPKVNFPSGGMGAGSGGSNDTFVFITNVDGDTVNKSMMKRNDMNKQSGDPHFVTGN